jgi:hypothetical protein
MFRRFALRRDPPPSAGGDTLPMLAPIEPLPLPRRGMTPARTALGVRLRAAGIHLAVSAGVALVVVALVLLAWYPHPMARLLGVDAILLIMLGVDVVLGPLFTLLVFDRRKKRLRWDLAMIAALQLLALGYGLHTIQQGRPAFVVLVKDRFEVVSPVELRAEDRAQARGNPFARPDPLGPRWVAAGLPDSAQERARILFESLTRGRDLQHHPKLYIAYEDAAGAALQRAVPIERLRALNPQRASDVDAAVAATGLPESALGYLPLRGPARDGAVLLARDDGRVLGVTSLAPW